MPGIVPSWIDRFDGARLEASPKRTEIVVRKRPATIAEADSLALEVKVVRARPENVAGPDEYAHATQWSFIWD